MLEFGTSNSRPHDKFVCVFSFEKVFTSDAFPSTTEATFVGVT